MRKNRQANQEKETGFTLIEVMVVIGIIALMGVAVVPRVIEKFQEAQQKGALQDINTIEGALKSYRMDNYRYPTQDQGLNALLEAPNGARNWRGPYIDEIEIPVDPWGSEYRYANPGTRGKDIDVFSFGADDAEGGDGVDTDIGNWTRLKDL